MLKYIWILFVLATLQTQAQHFFLEKGEWDPKIEDVYVVVLKGWPAKIVDINYADYSELFINAAALIDNSNKKQKLNVIDYVYYLVKETSISSVNTLFIFKEKDNKIIEPKFFGIGNKKKLKINISNKYLNGKWNIYVYYEGMSFSPKELENSKVSKLSDLTIKAALSYLNGIKNIFHGYNNAAELSKWFKGLYGNKEFILDVSEETYKNYIDCLEKLISTYVLPAAQIEEINRCINEVKYESFNQSVKEGKYRVFNPETLAACGEIAIPIKTLMGYSFFQDVTEFADNNGNKYVNIWLFKRGLSQEYGNNIRIISQGKLLLDGTWVIPANLYCSSQWIKSESHVYLVLNRLKSS